jgi:hypothetical protein
MTGLTPLPNMCIATAMLVFMFSLQLTTTNQTIFLGFFYGFCHPPSPENHGITPGHQTPRGISPLRCWPAFCFRVKASACGACGAWRAACHAVQSAGSRNRCGVAYGKHLEVGKDLAT